MSIFSRKSRHTWLSAEKNEWLLEGLRTAKFTHKSHRSGRLSYAVERLNAGKVLQAIDNLLRAFQIDQLLEKGGPDRHARIKFYQSGLDRLRIFHEPGSTKASLIALPEAKRERTHKDPAAPNRRTLRERETSEYRVKTFDLSRGHLSLYAIIQWLFEWRHSRSMDRRERMMWLKRSGLVVVGGHEPRRTIAAEAQIRHARKRLQTKGYSPLKPTHIALPNPEGADIIAHDDPSGENATISPMDVFTDSVDSSLPTFDAPKLDTTASSPEILMVIPEADTLAQDAAASPVDISPDSAKGTLPFLNPPNVESTSNRV